MRKYLALLLAAAALVFASSPAWATGAETGQGNDAQCPVLDENGDPVVDENGDPVTEPCGPDDPTADLPVLAGPVNGGQDDGGAGAGVSVGSEGAPDSLGRAAVYSDGSTVQIYLEDYTDGDQIADGVENANEATGCTFLPSDDCSAENDSPSDAALITIG